MKKDPLDSSFQLPMSVVYILVSLAGGELNIKNIRNWVLKQFNGLFRLNHALIEMRLSQMLDHKWIERDWVRRSQEEDPRTVYYRLLPLGRDVLAEQIQRLEKVAKVMKAQLNRSRAQASSASRKS